MKRDCPHCGKSTEGKYFHILKFKKPNAHRNCPLCGREIEYKTHPEEVGVRAPTIVAFIVAAYIAHNGEHGFFKPLAIGVAVIVAACIAVMFLVRNRQRFQKGRHAR